MNGQTVILAGESQRQLAKRLIDRAPPQAIVNIRESKRTLDQNALMWVLLSDIARAKPNGRLHSTDQWKAVFMASCDHKPVFLPDLDEESFVCAGYKSSRLCKAQMSELIECIYAYGAQNGVLWSDPAEARAA